MSLSPEDRDLLASARAELDPSAEDKKRVRGALAAQIGLVASMSATSATAGAGATGATGTAIAAASGAGTLTKTAGVFAIVAITSGIGAGAYVATRPRPAVVAPIPVETGAAPASSSAVSVPPPLTTTAPVTPPPVETTSAALPPTKTPSKAASASAAATVSPPAEGSLSAETHLVRDATSALQRGDGTTALASLDEHARRFPHGVLSEERDAQRVLALCSLGRTAEARTRAARFTEQHPRSALAAKVRDSCGGH
jgi:hypothetical protein